MTFGPLPQTALARILDKYRGDPTVRIVTITTKGDLSVYEARPRKADGVIILHWVDKVYNSPSERIEMGRTKYFRLAKYPNASRMVKLLCQELGWVYLQGAREGWRLSRCPESFQVWAELDIACKRHDKT